MSSVVSGLQAALLFARGRSDALRYVEQDMAGAARSFWAILICLPAVVCLRLIDWLQAGLPPHAAHAFGLDMIAYVVGWTGYAILTWYLVPLFGAGARWPRFIIAWNWCNVIENVLLVIGSLPGLLGAPGVVSDTGQLFAIGWALWIEWFAIKLTLGAGGFVAVWLVIVDQAIGLMLAGLNVSLMQG